MNKVKKTSFYAITTSGKLYYIGKHSSKGYAAMMLEDSKIQDHVLVIIDQRQYRNMINSLTVME